MFPPPGLGNTRGQDSVALGVSWQPWTVAARQKKAFCFPLFDRSITSTTITNNRTNTGAVRTNTFAWLTGRQFFEINRRERPAFVPDTQCGYLAVGKV